MTPAMRSFITDSLGCPVAQSYGASEFLAMGSECRRGALHLNSDWVILESVDEHHRPVPDGEVGRTTLLTNLANRVQPLIRYDLGDCVRLHAKHCACGSSLPVIDVQGRVDDSVVLNDAAGRAVRLLPLALTTVMEDEAGVYDFQILQQGHDALLLHVAAHGDDGSKQLERAQRALCHYLRAQGLAGVSVRGQSGKPGACGRSGKVQRVVAQAET
jgi:phenylacetate-coenzyme A ligase PaaK-like adenylate-forming protein